MAKNTDTSLAAFLARGGDPWAYKGALSDALTKALTPQVKGSRIRYDTIVAGFGLRVTPAGNKAYILNYRQARVERRITLGTIKELTVAQARQRAAAHRHDIREGKDPAAARATGQTTPLIRELIDRFEKEHVPLKAETTQKSYRADLATYIRPVFGNKLITAVTLVDIENLHARIVRGGAPFRANRVALLASALFSFAIKLKLLTVNPAKGIELIPGVVRQRTLTREEIERVMVALDLPRQGVHSDNNAASAIRLMIWTGARSSEVLKARWGQFDLTAGTWTKLRTDTKQKQQHTVPLSPAALALLRAMRKAALQDAPNCPFLFPGEKGHGRKWGEIPRTTIWAFWRTTCQLAGIEVVRPHDLRHTFASFLVSNAVPLIVVSKLLGHSSIVTTQRYSTPYTEKLQEAVGLMTVGGAS